MSDSKQISIWFFIGALLLIYGVLILISGMISAPPPGVVLTELHAPVWMGSLLTALGVMYCYLFFPGRK